MMTLRPTQKSAKVITNYFDCGFWIKGLDEDNEEAIQHALTHILKSDCNTRAV